MDIRTGPATVALCAANSFLLMLRFAMRIARRVPTAFSGGLEPLPTTARSIASYAASVRSNRATRAATTAIYAATAALLLSITWAFLQAKLDPNECRMSYMFPSYARVTAFDETHTRYAAKYSLFYYRDQKFDVGLNPVGTPVLFIPGNAGSYKQVRAIASESARRYAQDYAPKGHPSAQNLDFFTADFNEDLTAFHGRTMLDQAEYLNDAVTYILSLYAPGPEAPTSVILLGHSMGGIVARVMLTLPNYVHGSVNTIVTLASPHSVPPVTFDADIVRIYDEMNGYWRSAFSGTSNPLQDVSLASITGGSLDTVLPSDYTATSSVVPKTHGFNIFTTGVPYVWTSIDHLAIVWCDELRRVLATVLLEITDRTRPQRTKPLPERMAVFAQYLSSGFEDTAELRAASSSTGSSNSISGSANSLTIHSGSASNNGGAVGSSQHSNRATSFDAAVPIRFDAAASAEATSTVSPGPSIDTLLTMDAADATSDHVDPVNSVNPVNPVGPYITRVHSLAAADTVRVLTDLRPLAAGDSAPAEGGVYVLLCRERVGRTTAATLDVRARGARGAATTLECANVASRAAVLPASRLSEPAAGSEDPDVFYYIEVPAMERGRFDRLVTVEARGSAVDSFVKVDASPDAPPATVPRQLLRMLFGGVRVPLRAGALVSEVLLQHARTSLLVFRVEYVPSGNDYIKNSQNGPRFSPFLRQSITDPYESRVSVGLAKNKVQYVAFHGIAPYVPHYDANAVPDDVRLQVWQDSTAPPLQASSLNISVDLWRSLGNLVMRYRQLVASVPVSVVCAVLLVQFYVYNRSGVFMSFADALALFVYRYLAGVLTVVAALPAILGCGPVRCLLHFLDPAATQTAQQLRQLSPQLHVNEFFLGTGDAALGVLGAGVYLAGVGLVFVVERAVETLAGALAAGVVALAVRSGGVDSKEKSARAGKPRGLQFTVNANTVSVLDSRRRTVTTLILFVTVWLWVPYQFAYTVGVGVLSVTYVRLLATLELQKRSGVTGTAPEALVNNFRHYLQAILIIMVWILPVNVPVLVVWLHNLAIRWQTPFSSHHNFLSIAAIIVLTERIASGSMIPSSFKKPQRIFTEGFLVYMAVYALVYGCAHTFWLHHLLNAFAAWLLVVYVDDGT